MVKSVWNKNKSKNILRILIVLIIYEMRIYDYEFTSIYFNNNFMKTVIPVIAFIILFPVFGKTPYWIYKNKKNISKDKKLYHRKKSTDKLLDLYLYFVLPIINIIGLLMFIGVGGDYKLKVIIFFGFSVPAIAFVLFYNSNYFRLLKSKRIRFAIYFAVLLIYLFLTYMLGYYIVSNAVK